MKKPCPYILSETNWKFVKKEQYSTVILPWGATEAHNYHLPYGTDNYLVQQAAKQSTEKAWANGASNSYSIKTLRDGWVKSQQKWISVTKDTGVGNPKKATKTKGKLFFEATTDSIADFLSNLDKTPLENLYEQ